MADEQNAVIPIDDQPMAATFFGEGRWLSDFITPDAFEVQELYKEITKGIDNAADRISACWKWVASRVRYVTFVTGKMWIEGKVSVQKDLWTLPETTIRTRVGNCAVKSLLLTSLLRNELSTDQVYCAMGNLYNGTPGGHAWVSLKQMAPILPEGEYVMESTMPTAPAMVPASTAKRYEPVHYFNDATVYAVEGRTQLVPMCACFSTWLSDYLNWVWIEAQKTAVS